LLDVGVVQAFPAQQRAAFARIGELAEPVNLGGAPLGGFY
jgi:hypothetical protein